jgi:5-methylcytosine-specific restriction endonuclease McrA
MLERVNKKYSVEEIKEFYYANINYKEIKKKVVFDGHLVKVYSQRYELFFTKSLVCCRCGLEGLFFYKERSVDSIGYHFNLYGLNEDNEEILLTKDHITPTSLGGLNRISNYQTMCTKCNNSKGNTVCY